MALTKKYLTTLGIEADKVDEIINAHSETVNALKADRDDYKANAEKYAATQSELDALKTSVKDSYIAKSEYDKVVSDFESYKAEIAKKESKAAKENAVRAYFEGKGISGKNLEIAMRGSSAEISEVELDKTGKIKDVSALDGLVTGVYGGLVSSGPRVDTSGSLSGGTPKAETSNDVMNALIRGAR